MKPKHIGAFAAKTQLSKILDRVDRGQVYVITKRGRPVAELRPIAAPTGIRFGMDAGKITMSEDFDAPLEDFKDYE